MSLRLRDGIASLTRYSHSLCCALLLAGTAAACTNETARAPNPTAYDWPDSLAYRVQEVAQANGAGQPVARLEHSRLLRLVVGYDGAYSVTQEGVHLTDWPVHGAPTARQLLPEDTLRYFVRLSRWGEFLSAEPACDPAVPACRDAPPSSLLMGLRRLVPRLPVWWPPKGRAWEDTLVIDDAARPRGLRGTLTTVYRAPRDTVAGGQAYWIVTWRSAWRPAAAPGVGIARGIEAESAVVYVDKLRLVPALAIWGGAEPPSSGPRGPDAARTEVRGRAVLVGSAFDAPLKPEEGR